MVYHLGRPHPGNSFLQTMIERVVTVVLGSQFGDEGKGKLVDILSDTADVCARCQGGNNAGHTILASGIKYDCHLLPSGRFFWAISLYFRNFLNYHATSSWLHFDWSGLINPKTDNLIGSGVVVHIPSFFSELQALENKGLSTTGRIFISSRSHIVLNLDQLVDKWEETALGNKSVGTTRKGIGPTYSSKASRNGLRIGELRLESWDLFEVRFR